jgi:hypothetical protein
MDDTPNFAYSPADEEALENRRRARAAASYADMSETRRLSELYANSPAEGLAAIEKALREAEPNTAVEIPPEAASAFFARRPAAPGPRLALLAEREFTHGNFSATALIAQRFKDVSKNTPNWSGNLTDVQRESLEGIFTKIARILSGDPNHPDHWRDIEGGAHLVSEQL